MTSGRFRRRTISIRLTDSEYASITAAAGPKSLSEWGRSVLLESLTKPAVDELLVSEMWATQTLVATVLARLAANDPITFDVVRQLRDSIASDKRRKARQLLDAAKQGGPSEALDEDSDAA